MKSIRILVITVALATGLYSQSISGELKDGLRYLDLDTGKSLNFTVYRGDYIKFKSNSSVTVKIPSLDFKETLPKDHPYIKMKKIGKYEILVGENSGIIEVIDYSSPSYKEVTAKEAFDLIENISPLILDVRTPGEYEAGHIENSILIPVQILRGNLDRIEEYKNEPIFIYCRSGNRSTVASQILIENGFNNIYNLRYGIGDWANRGYKISK